VQMFSFEKIIFINLVI